MVRYCFIQNFIVSHFFTATIFLFVLFRKYSTLLCSFYYLKPTKNIVIFSVLYFHIGLWLSNYIMTKLTYTYLIFMHSIRYLILHLIFLIFLLLFHISFYISFATVAHLYFEDNITKICYEKTYTYFLHFQVLNQVSYLILVFPKSF